jgi:hypothetical protein
MIGTIKEKKHLDNMLRDYAKKHGYILSIRPIPGSPTLEFSMEEYVFVDGMGRGRCVYTLSFMLSNESKGLVNRIQDIYKIYDDITNKVECELGHRTSKDGYRSYCSFYDDPMYNSVPRINNVIFKDPATIVFWADGTKTVVKCQPGDTFNPETGLAMAIAKKALGNKGNYCNVFHEWLDKEDEKQNQLNKVVSQIAQAMTGETDIVFWDDGTKTVVKCQPVDQIAQAMTGETDGN